MPASKAAAAPARSAARGLDPPPAGAPLPSASTRFLKRPEVRDVLAWMRLLLDPQDAAAVVRALGRPPIGLRQVDLARVIQVARRRRADLIVGLAAATESPRVPPEARERIGRFVALHHDACADLEELQPDLFLGRLIERLGGVGGLRSSLLAPEEAAEQDESLARLLAMAGDFLARVPSAGTRELARHLTTAVPEAEQEDEAAERGDRLEQALCLLREQLLESVARIGGRLGELRLDTDLDISHGVVRYLELLKVAALLQRPPGQDVAEALADIDVRLLAAATPLQREILQTSTLDETLLAGGSLDRASIGAREEHSLGPFLPRKGEGVALSASDIVTYRSCPLRYKFARVLRIPTEQTVHQRFGIAVHQVLERYHSDGASTLAQLLELLESGWRRSGLGREGQEGELYEKARTALTRYHGRLRDQDSQPVWFERGFSFRLGPHHVRGRVDRVDALAEGSEVGYELIDYKTSRPKTAEQLADDVQLSLYALAAREDWQLPSSRQAYYYVLDDLRVPVPRAGRDADAVRELVRTVGDGILAQAFEPTPSAEACSMCDYRIVCPDAAV
ncbi:MAG: RecB family exonuclease [Solirubrobacteraceae bacterium]